ncbi:MAG: endonuclease [Bacteroidetes bacterium GWF2_42_66]|nr:MAG: endonuclease [Bacteroidetes bacterium GWA2_42_15]OFX96692.1 MAG: endonuclease [Bacteroidetes bacterium GWE2_42_39]OFY45395.1 MAG: endonuclease [Bacteroidetes bacterium GWF2_42_66]HBL73673.1 endonuclease [Prolixibacteraceae bacterium]HCR92186.1 endonuclease [Prolixibacteraceae bacterium]
MKKIKVHYIGLILLMLFSASISAKPNKAEKAGWKLGVQTYTFHKFSFQEAIDKAKELGLSYAEVYYGQPLGKDIEGKMDFRMDKETQKTVLAYAKSKGVKIIASGVVACKDEAEWKQLFEFASAMGIEIITCEPDYKHLKYVDELANQYKIDVAIHNHPKPSAYWSPELFLDAVKGLSNRIGACADVGHWKRMGIEPVTALKMYEGRLKSLHFKDIKGKVEGEKEQHDVIWGAGVCDVESILKELKRQNFKGLFSIEYEYNWENSVPDIKQCISYFTTTTNRLF